MAFLVEGSEGEGASAPAVPIQCLTTEEAVRRWSSSPGLMGFTGWLRRRCEKIRGREIMDDGWGGSSIVRLVERAGGIANASDREYSS